MDSSDKSEREGGLVKRSVVFNNDIKSTNDHICNIRGYPSKKDLYFKLGADYGGGFLKVNSTIESLAEPTTDNSDSVDKKWSYESGFSATGNYKDGGVKRLTILAMAEKTSETYHNLQTIMSWLKKKPINFQKAYKLFTYSFDWKCAAVFFGLGPASSYYPCLWCIMPKKDFNSDTELQGGRLRTMKDIRENAEEFQLALSNYTRKTKLSSKNYFNCEHPPLDYDLPDECTVLSVLPPMSLHCCTLGPVNLLYDILEIILEIVSYKLRADHWAKACALERESHYGGKAQFNGPQCHKLLRSRHILVGLLIEHSLAGQCKPIMNAFDRLYDVIQSCCGMVLYPRYCSDIRY